MCPLKSLVLVMGVALTSMAMASSCGDGDGVDLADDVPHEDDASAEVRRDDVQAPGDGDIGDVPDQQDSATHDLSPDDTPGPVEVDGETLTDLPDLVDGADDGLGDARLDASDVDGAGQPELPELPSAPEPGEVILSELMIDPSLTSDLDGEWIEFVNVAPGPRDLAGCTIGVNAEAGHPLLSVGEASVLAPGEHRVAGPNPDTTTNGGVAVAMTYSGLLLSNSGQAVVLACGGVAIDRVVYDAAKWVVSTGHALSFSADAPQSASDNDEAWRWCAVDRPYGDGDHGTPGTANPACPPQDGTVDFCELVSPVAATISEGEPLLVVARLLDEGDTDVSSGVDPIYFLVAEAGFGPADSQPTTEGWTWIEARGTPGWDDSEAVGGSGADQYEASASLVPAGTWAVAFRFSMDAGDTFSYCDRDGDDGAYDPDDAGTVTVVDNPCVPNPCTTPPPPRCEGALLIEARTPGECRQAGAAPSCVHDEVATDCSVLGAQCVEGACVGVAVSPQPGQVIFSEIMKNPASVSDALGEWLELTNVSDHAVDISGCVLTDRLLDAHTIVTSGPLVIAPGHRVVLGRSDDPALNGGIAVDHVYSDFLLNNGADVVILECGHATVDSVAYDPQTFPNDSGRSMQLNPSHFDATANDEGHNWCRSQLAIAGEGSTDIGTPGAPNHACPDSVDVCRLIAPSDVALLTTQSFVTRGAVLKLGITDLSAGVDVDPVLVAEAGHGPDGQSPQGSQWVFYPAAPIPGWDDGAETGFDGYEATVDAPDVAGDYDIAFRFSADGGISWTYCDRDTGVPGEDGSQNGYQSSNSGRLSATEPDPCNPNPCNSPPSGSCAGQILSHYPEAGACSVAGTNLDAAQCDYTVVTTNCGALGGFCSQGTCRQVAPLPQPGDVVITEIMKRPSLVSDFFGEWIELTNVSGRQLNLHGCTLRDEDNEDHTLQGPEGGVLMDGDARLVFGRNGALSANGGVALDYVYGDALSLANSADEIVLECGDALIDRVAWGEAGAAQFPDTTGAAMQLHVGSTDADDNDDGARWCDALTAYGSGQLGSPGAPNHSCN